MSNGDQQPPRSLPRQILPWILMLVFVGAVILFPYLIMRGGIGPQFVDLFKKNFIVIFGLPLGALLALFIVVFLEYTRGPIEFEGLGFKFKGGSGPIVLWVLCYLAITLSFSVLWNSNIN